MSAQALLGSAAMRGTHRKPHNRAPFSGTGRNRVTSQGGLLTGGLLVRVQPGELRSSCKAARNTEGAPGGALISHPTSYPGYPLIVL